MHTECYICHFLHGNHNRPENGKKGNGKKDDGKEIVRQMMVKKHIFMLKLLSRVKLILPGDINGVSSIVMK